MGAPWKQQGSHKLRSLKQQVWEEETRLAKQAARSRVNGHPVVQQMRQRDAAYKSGGVGSSQDVSVVGKRDMPSHSAEPGNSHTTEGQGSAPSQARSN